MRSIEKWRHLTSLAYSQNGMFTSRQAAQAGFRRDALTRFVANGSVLRMRRSVYLLSGVPIGQWSDTQALWLSLHPTGACLSSDYPFGVISHYWAASMHDLGPIDANVVDITHPEWPVKRTVEFEIHRGVVSSPDWWLVDGLPVTSPHRTLVDVTAAGIDGDHFGQMVVTSVMRHQVSLDKLASDLDAHAMAYGFNTGQQFLAHVVRAAGIDEGLIQLALMATSTTNEYVSASIVQSQISRTA